MTTFARQREITAIAILLFINAFLGISDKETKFIFPIFGQEVFTIINFYAGTLAIIGVAFGLVILYRFLNNKPLNVPLVPSTPAVILNYTIFIMASYLLISWIITGSYNTIPVPKLKDIIEQNIIGADENTISFIFLATIFPLGTGVGDFRKIRLPFIGEIDFHTPWNLLKLGDYSLNFNPPNFNRFKYGLYAVTLITLLHAGAYSYQVSTFNEFYIALLIAFILFNVLWWIKETFGYGACIATHVSWNLVLITVRGSVF